MSKVSSFIDSLEFSIGRSKKKDFKFDEIKEKRSKTLEEFNRNNQFAEEYLERDCKELPGFIFCVKEVYEKYKNLDGFAKAVLDCDTDTRKAWLDLIGDKSKIYFDTFNRLLNESYILRLEDEKTVIKRKIEQILRNVIPETEYEFLETITHELESFKSAKIKSKKVKEVYSNAIYNLDKLIQKTNLPIHLYLTNILKLDIFTNADIEQNSENMIFLNYIDKLNELSYSQERELKYIKNTLTAVKENLYNVITEIKERNHEFAKREGKYFKKWSLLTPEEKEERITAWVKYYIYKNFMIGKVISTEDEMNNLVENLSSLLNSKKISYRFIKWDSKSGLITTINGITYNTTTNDFSFSGHAKEDDTSSQITTTGLTDASCKKKKEDKLQLNEKVINDIVLQGILRDKSEEECIEQIRTKLNLKKLTSKEKGILSKKYISIKDIIDANKS
jgi:hypothetical protein